MSKKNIIIIAIAIVLIIAGIVILNTRKSNNNQSIGQEETQSKVAEKKTNGTYEIYNTDIITNLGKTVIEATIKNVSNTKTPEQFIEIVLVDKSGNEMGTLKATVPSLNSNEATELSVESVKKFNDVYDFKIR